MSQSQRSTHITHLGDSTFCQDHGIRLAYLAGAMAGGIASVELVKTMAKGKMLGIFGAAGLHPERVEKAIVELKNTLGQDGWGANLIHSPYEPGLEDAVVDLYLKHDVPRVSASAYLRMSLPIVRYRLHGIHTHPSGKIITPKQVIGKISRIEVAKHFFAPAPEKMLRTLVEQGHLTEAQARLAEKVPVAQDLIVEADSGGHTDNRPALCAFPTMMALRERAQEQFDIPLRLGAAGGIGTPHAAAAAFAMGADFIVTGSINQACVESGTSDLVRQMLAEAGQGDVAMAPAADMFEMGVKLQVLKRGTLFPMRADKLYDAYRKFDSIDAIDSATRTQIEDKILRAPMDAIWAETQTFWQHRDPRQLERAAENPKHKMALLFRWYLGQGSRWATQGLAERKGDFQVWCGPAMGAFNEWVKGSHFEPWQNREARPIALNILRGAAAILDQTQARIAARAKGEPAAPIKAPKPLPMAELEDEIR